MKNKNYLLFHYLHLLYKEHNRFLISINKLNLIYGNIRQNIH